MNYLFIHASHDGTITIVQENKVIVHTQIDRFNRFKYTSFPSRTLIEFINSLNLEFKEVHITGLTNNHCAAQWAECLQSDIIVGYETQVYVDVHSHHNYHAYSNQLISPFNKSHHLVWDLHGDLIFKKDKFYAEQTSIYDDDLKVIHKEWFDNLEGNVCIGSCYKSTTDGLGLNGRNDFNDGKTMALSSYGKFNQEIFNHIYNKNFIRDSFKDLKLSTLKEDTYSQDFVKTFQTACELKAEEIVSKIDSDNLTLTGGVAQNILINTRLSKHKKIFVNPFCTDQGISLGKAYSTLKGKIEKLNTVYLGFKHTFNRDIFFKNFSLVKANYKDVSKILLNEPVAIYQGRSEQGPRALGNRSLLMNPAHRDAVKKVNDIKKREWYRPFTCSILNENFEEYFFANYNTTPYYMNFVYKVKQNQEEKLKSVLSVDGYSRVQCVKAEHNTHYYNLIKTFNKMYGIPVLLNTSLNLPGMPVVESYEDLKNILLKSNLKYCFLPEHNILITKNVVN